jgi:hypothetical protein
MSDPNPVYDGYEAIEVEQPSSAPVSNDGTVGKSTPLPPQQWREVSNDGTIGRKVPTPRRYDQKQK